MHRLLIVVAAVALTLAAVSLVAGANPQTVGLFINEPGAYEGYTLFAPMQSSTAYLIDNEGRLVHSWDTNGGGAAPYLLEDGSLIRSGAGGARRFAWDGTPLWDFDYPGAHHDIEVLPNGNVLMIVRETFGAAQAIAAGRDPALLQEGFLYADSILEIEPTGPTSGNVVWEWRSWDHLVQDFDPMKKNFGVVADDPELIDLNFTEFYYVIGGDADWHHSNSLDYNEELDQIVISVRHFSEFWVIDHSTTSAEAASHAGGDRGKGGDLLYRWGNEKTYVAYEPDEDAVPADDPREQRLYYQHDAQWIEEGLPGEGNILVFNNGNNRWIGIENYSSVDELAPPIDEFGNYSLTPGQAYGPTALEWTYQAPDPTDFYSSFISGAQRLPNGNTLIDSGGQSTFFEVTSAGETVWRYVNPVSADGPLAQGDDPGATNIVFRAYRYGVDFPGLQGRDLTPGGVIELPKPTPASAPTPTITPMPTLEPPVGDVNSDGFVTSVDALLILQHDAHLLPTLPDLNIADVNLDGEVTAVDAALILQFTAGFLDELPP